MGEPPRRQHVLIAGVSTRAAASSAASAGFRTTTIDAFADRDRHPDVRSVTVPGGYSTPAAARVARDIGTDAVVYTSGFENHPDAVCALASEGELWGNASSVLRRVRDPASLMEGFRGRGLRVPETHLAPPAAGPDTRDFSWLVKPTAAGGGHGVRDWGGGGVPSDHYLQERIAGSPGSVAFVASGGRAMPLGVFRQLIGDDAFGARGYQYCGNILDCGETSGWTKAATALADAAAGEFGLVGVNGIDFVARPDALYPVELNPRWCASMELVERAYGLSVFAAHAAAFSLGILPEFDPRRFEKRTTEGKAILFARENVRIGDTDSWIEDGVADVPHQGTAIRSGRPVCTVFASEDDPDRCYRALVRRANRIFDDLRAWTLSGTRGPGMTGSSPTC